MQINKVIFENGYYAFVIFRDTRPPDDSRETITIAAKYCHYKCLNYISEVAEYKLVNDMPNKMVLNKFCLGIEVL